MVHARGQEGGMCSLNSARCSRARFACVPSHLPSLPSALASFQRSAMATRNMSVVIEVPDLGLGDGALAA
eukprot:714813-Alexandrium_andersonii.AAC.1